MRLQRLRKKKELYVKSLLWFPCVLTVYSKSYLDKLLKLQKRVVRFIYFSDHNQHAIPLFSDAGILPLQFSYYDLAANLMLDIRRRSAPRIIRDLFEDISNIHS